MSFESLQQQRTADTPTDTAVAVDTAEADAFSTFRAWEQRFRAARVELPDWAEAAPARSLFVSNATGASEG